MRKAVFFIFLFLAFSFAKAAFALDVSYSAGLRYGISISSLGQDPFMEGFNDRVTYTNAMLSNEIRFNKIFGLELGLLLDERGYAERTGNKTSYSLYFLELPLVAKIYPLKFLYLGAGFGYAYKYKVAKYKEWQFNSTIHGVDNFVDEKTRDHEANFVLVLGFRVNIINRFSLISEIRHNYGLTNINAHSQATILFPKEDFIERFRGLYFMVGFNIRII